VCVCVCASVFSEHKVYTKLCSCQIFSTLKEELMRRACRRGCLD